MANTRSATLSIRLKSETKRRLAKLAAASGRSSNFLISDAVESYVADQERLLAEFRQADRQVKSGHYIKHEDMKAWLLSWERTVSCHRRSAPAARCMMTRRCAGRHRLVSAGAHGWKRFALTWPGTSRTRRDGWPRASSRWLKL